jgi:hypothetical protein
MRPGIGQVNSGRRHVVNASEESSQSGRTASTPLADRVGSLVDGLQGDSNITIRKLDLQPGSEWPRKKRFPPRARRGRIVKRMPGDILDLYAQIDGFAIEWWFEDWDKTLASMSECVGGWTRFETLASFDTILDEPEGDLGEVLAEDEISRGCRFTVGRNVDSFLVEASPGAEALSVYVYESDCCAGDIPPLNITQFVELGLALGFMTRWEEAWREMYDNVDPDPGAKPDDEALEWMARVRLARLGFIDPADLTLPPALLAKVLLIFERDQQAQVLFEQADPATGPDEYRKHKATMDKIRRLVDQNRG